MQERGTTQLVLYCNMSSTILGPGPFSCASASSVRRTDDRMKLILGDEIATLFRYVTRYRKECSMLRTSART